MIPQGPYMAFSLGVIVGVFAMGVITAFWGKRITPEKAVNYLDRLADNAHLKEQLTEEQLNTMNDALGIAKNVVRALPETEPPTEAENDFEGLDEDEEK